MTILSPQMLLAAYSQGLFPMANAQGEIAWYDPNPRAILPLETFRVSRRLARKMRHCPFELRIDSAFRATIEACARSAPRREETWLSTELIEAYCKLHELGFAHSVEAWQAEQLVGGLYGVALRGLFAGESMFSIMTDASKVALVYLVERLQQGGFQLLDTQFLNPHLAQFGALEIPRAAYKERLKSALAVETSF